MKKHSKFPASFLVASLLPFAAANAANAVPDSITPPQSFTVGGAVGGLVGSGLVLGNSKFERLSILTNGAFTFPDRKTIGQSYDVVVVTQPSAPVQACTVANGSGTVKTNVTNIRVTCTGGGPPPLTFDHSTPANGTTGVARNVEALLDFSAPLAGQSISTDVVKLRDSSGASVPEFLSFTGSNLFGVTGQAKLLPLTRYTVNVGTGLRGTGGQVLVNPVTVGFTTRDGLWQSPLSVGTNSTSAGTPTIVMDPLGNAIAVWSEQFGTTFEIWSNRFRVDAGWGTPQRISAAAVDAFFPSLSVDGAGSAIAVWTQRSTSTGSTTNVFANRFTVASGWGTAIQIEAHAAGVSAGSANVALEPNGSALAVWTVPTPTVSHALASRFTPATGWGQPQHIDNNTGSVDGIAIGLDASGNGTAVWTQSDGTRNNVWSNRFAAGSSWGTPVLIENVDIGSAFLARMAVDPSGNATVIWQDSIGVNINLFANRFTAGGAWGTPQIIGTPRNNADAQIAAAANGDAMVVWEQSTTGNLFNIASNRFTPTTGWSSPVLVETHTDSRSFLSHVALDRLGNAIAVWQQDVPGRSNNQSIFANRFTPTGGWGAAPIQLIINTGFTGAGVPRIAIDPNGDALAIWNQQVGSGTFNVISNRLE